MRLVFEGCVGVGHAQEFDGIAVIEKKVILFGGDSTVSVFRSSPANDGFCAMPEPCQCEKNLPQAVVEVVDPIVLDVKVLEHVHHCICPCCCCDIPENVTATLAGNMHDNDTGRFLAVSLGIFSVIRIVRPSQYLVSAQEYCIPDKECVQTPKDDPCSVFKTMAFPISEFGCAPMTSHFEKGRDGKCGCGS